LVQKKNAFSRFSPSNIDRQMRLRFPERYIRARSGEGGYVLSYPKIIKIDLQKNRVFGINR
jgi:hypothetical protein